MYPLFWAAQRVFGSVLVTRRAGRTEIPSTSLTSRINARHCLVLIALLTPAASRASDGGTPIDLADVPGLESRKLDAPPDGSSQTATEPFKTQHEVRTPRFQWEQWNPNETATPLVSGSIEASVMNEMLGRWNVGGCASPTCVSNRPGFHPGTRVIVETHPISQRTNRWEAGLLLKLQADFRSRGYWLYRNCFESTARNTESAGGDIWLRLQVSRGAVYQSQVVSTTIRQRSIVSCVKDSTRMMRVSPVEKRVSIFVLRVRLFPGDVPLSPTRRRAPGVEPLNPTRFDATIGPIRRSIEECALQGLQRDPALWGRISLRVQVRLDRRIGNVREDDSHFPDRAVVECCHTSLLNKTLASPPVVGELRLAVRVGELAIPGRDQAVAPLAPIPKPGN